MRSTFVTFVATLIVITTGLLLYSALGIVRNSDDPAAGVVVAKFGTALRSRDGKAACALLSRQTQSSLEDQRKKPCEQGILEIASDVEPKAAVDHVNVAESSAFVETTDGNAFFLGRVDGKWFLDAAECERQAGDAPYTCALES